MSGPPFKLIAQYKLALSATVCEPNLMEVPLCPNQRLSSDLHSALFC